MEMPSSSELKLYVGRLTGDMAEEEIRDYFASKFGEVKDLVILKDRVTGERRGYGFVEFVDPDSAAAALEEVEHEIAGKKVTVSKARHKDQQRQNYQSAQDQHPAPGMDVSTGLNNSSNAHANNGNPPKFKIFVGGVSSSTSEEDFKSYFEQFGTITDAVIMYDRDTGRRRGFGFVTFESNDAFNKVMQDKYHKLKDKRVEVCKAVPMKVNNNSLLAHSGSNYDFDGGKGKEPVDDNRRGYFVEHDPRCAWQNHISAYSSVYQFYGTCIYGSDYPYGGYDESFNPRIPYNNLETYGNAAMYASYPNLGINGCMAGTSGYGHHWVPGKDTGGYGHHWVPVNERLIQSVDNMQITKKDEETIQSVNNMQITKKDEETIQSVDNMQITEKDEETTVVENAKSDAQQMS